MKRKSWAYWLFWGLLILMFFGVLGQLNACGDIFVRDTNPKMEKK